MKRKILCFFILIIMLLIGCTGQITKVNPDQFIQEQTRDEVIVDDFIYRLVTEKSTYQNEEIVMYAELEYIGEQDNITIYHAASPFHFPMIEKTREYTIEYGMNEPLISTTLKRGEALREKYRASGGFDLEDTKEYREFMKAIMNKKFPVGYYLVNGYADFFIEKMGSKPQEYKIEGQVDFIVEK
ncbi:hypothetical protein JOC85_001736 [Bacillus mesophilus]|uniref:Lipoprotein n=1 Tax=Bacillus mesophilus TaxID=1808955 RepID=A0A6M0Q5G0_9BACI|nr:hypothetical protein [Bacillus mesophilus]MBM7660964.1 hypothetical protein [Bacillus mesophilus]NEY71494.1 hypothetical protein [Bacillus mesophilus]